MLFFYTITDKCPSGYCLANSPDFVICNNTDNTQLLWTALGYSSGGKALHRLCIQEMK